MLDYIYQDVDDYPKTDTYIIFSGDGHFSSVATYLKKTIGKRDAERNVGKNCKRTFMTVWWQLKQKESEHGKGFYRKWWNHLHARGSEQADTTKNIDGFAGMRRKQQKAGFSYCPLRDIIAAVVNHNTISTQSQIIRHICQKGQGTLYEKSYL